MINDVLLVVNFVVKSFSRKITIKNDMLQILEEILSTDMIVFKLYGCEI